MTTTPATVVRPTSVFAEFETKAFPYRYLGQLTVDVIAGGIPSDAHVAEGWLKSKLAAKDDIIRDLVAQTMIERGVAAEEATKLVDLNKHLNGFKRDQNGLYIEGRQLKSALKEAVSVSVAAGKLKMKGWGVTNKSLLGFLAEHVFVEQDRLALCDSSGAYVKEPTGIVQRFVSTWRGTGIQYEEYVENVTFDFSVIADFLFTEEQWAMIWLTGQQQGVGASRSQGFGRYVITKWEQVS